MSSHVVKDLRGLSLSALELTALTDWVEPVVADYLTISENLLMISQAIDNIVNNDPSSNTKEVVVIGAPHSPYVPLPVDEEIFCNTAQGGILIYLPPGTKGRHLRISNIGVTANKVTLIPHGSDLLFGSSGSELVYTSEVLIMTFATSEGWN